MKAIILAAGVGSRLGDLTKELPKPLVDVNGKSIIERQISSFRKAGIDDIILVIGPFAEKYLFKNVKYINGKKSFSHNILYSLIEAKSEMTDDVIISYGDIIFEDKIIEQILNTKNDIVIGVEPKWREYYEKRMDNPPAISDFIAIKNGKIIKLFRNLKEFDEDCIITEFSGLFKLSAKGSKIITEKYEFLEQNHSGKFHDAVSLKKAKMIELLQELYENGVSMEAISLKGKWCEIDTPHDLEIAKKMFK